MFINPLNNSAFINENKYKEIINKNENEKNEIINLIPKPTIYKHKYLKYKLKYLKLKLSY